MTAAPETFDVLVIGAGINGAGLFRDLCEQGLKVAIVDKGDFGSGTSAAPSRLIHGGLKYLETGEFGLVAQSTLERNLLLRNAPHLVRPLPTVIPIFSWLNGVGAALRTLLGSTTAPRSRGAVLIRIGLALYDFYGARQRVMPRHEFWSKSRALEEVPSMTPGIVAAGLYYDAKIASPERLVLELVKDGLKASPHSCALNHAEFLGRKGDVLGYRAANGTLCAIRPRFVANAAGPWIDKVNEALGAPTKLIGGTKGSHIVLDHPDLLTALAGRMIYFEKDDGRICLAFDYLGRALVGSTDLRADNPDTVRCEDHEIDYLLTAIATLFPTLMFAREQIVYAYSGIRPLPASGAGQPGLISRDHSAPMIEASDSRAWPIVSLVGGKWTTFRGFAEEVSDLVLKRLDAPRKVSTRELPIGGGRGFPVDEEARAVWLENASRDTGGDDGRASVLLDRYGSTALDILAHEVASLDAMLPDAKSYSLAELEWIARHEQVVRLSDLVLRRTGLAVSGNLSLRDLHAIARAIGLVLGWDDRRRIAEVDDTVRSLVDIHRWRPA